MLGTWSSAQCATGAEPAATDAQPPSDTPFQPPKSRPTTRRSQDPRAKRQREKAAKKMANMARLAWIAPLACFGIGIVGNLFRGAAPALSIVVGLIQLMVLLAGFAFTVVAWVGWAKYKRGGIMASAIAGALLNAGMVVLIILVIMMMQEMQRQMTQM